MPSAPAHTEESSPGSAAKLEVGVEIPEGNEGERTGAADRGRRPTQPDDENDGQVKKV